MVNEMNRPPPGVREDEALQARLEASNRNIENMQREHEQLMAEMQRLRQRAADLTALRDATRERLREEQENQDLECDSNNNTNGNMAAADEAMNETYSSNATPPIVDEASAPPAAPAEDHVVAVAEETEAAEAAYLRDKIAEIASLKAQFQRVHHLIDTTKKIEEHLARDPLAGLEATGGTSGEAVPAADHPVSAVADVTADMPNLNVADRAPRDTADVINDMTYVCNTFSNDLREQVAALRAERDRVRALKEEILRRRQNPT